MLFGGRPRRRRSSRPRGRRSVAGVCARFGEASSRPLAPNVAPRQFSNRRPHLESVPRGMADEFEEDAQYEKSTVWWRIFRIL
jgi:hypothetical protein